MLHQADVLAHCWLGSGNLPAIALRRCTETDDALQSPDAISMLSPCRQRVARAGAVAFAAACVVALGGAAAAHTDAPTTDEQQAAVATAAALGTTGTGEDVGAPGNPTTASEEPARELTRLQQIERRAFFKYEKRLRKFSTHEKTFEYFSSRTVDGQPSMTAADVLRALLAVYPPDAAAWKRCGSLPGEASPPPSLSHVRCLVSSLLLFAVGQAADVLKYCCDHSISSAGAVRIVHAETLAHQMVYPRANSLCSRAVGALVLWHKRARDTQNGWHAGYAGAECAGKRATAQL